MVPAVFTSRFLHSFFHYVKAQRHINNEKMGESLSISTFGQRNITSTPILTFVSQTFLKRQLSTTAAQDGDTLKAQLKMTEQLDFLERPYHQALVNGEVPSAFH